MPFEGKGLLGIKEFKNEQARVKGKASAASKRQRRIETGGSVKERPEDAQLHREAELREKISAQWSESILGQAASPEQRASLGQVIDGEMVDEGLFDATERRFSPGGLGPGDVDLTMKLTISEWHAVSNMRAGFDAKPADTVFINPITGSRMKIQYNRAHTISGCPS